LNLKAQFLVVSGKRSGLMIALRKKELLGQERGAGDVPLAVGKSLC